MLSVVPSTVPPPGSQSVFHRFSTGFPPVLHRFSTGSLLVLYGFPEGFGRFSIFFFPSSFRCRLAGFSSIFLGLSLFYGVFIAVSIVGSITISISVFIKVYIGSRVSGKNLSRKDTTKLLDYRRTFVFRLKFDI